MSLTVLIVLTHPDPKSFKHAIAASAVETLEKNGHTVCFHGAALSAPSFPQLHHLVDDDPVGPAESHDLFGPRVTGRVGLEKFGGLQHVQDVGEVT